MTETSDEIIKVQEDSKLDDIEHKEIKDPYGFIYITTNLINGKKYLGQKTFDRKWENYLGSGTLFKYAVNKYGKENFSRNIIYICDSADELNTVEYELSVLFNVVESPDWYNLVYGGGTTSGMIVSEDTRIKQSEARKRNSIIHPEYDQYHGEKMIEFYENHPDAKERISDRFKQLWQDKDYVVKMSQSKKAYWDDENNRMKRGEIIKETWKDPDVRTARLSGLKEWVANPENFELTGAIQSIEMHRLKGLPEVETQCMMCIDMVLIAQDFFQCIV